MTAVELAMEMVHATVKDDEALYDYKRGRMTFEELKKIRDECWLRLDKARQQLKKYDEAIVTNKGV